MVDYASESLDDDYEFDKPGKLQLILGLALIIGGPILAWFFWSSTSEQSVPQVQLVVPGTHELVFDEPGLQAVAYEYRSVVDGRKFKTSNEAPQLAFKLTNTVGGWDVDLKQDWNPVSYSMGERAGRSIYFFSIEHPGTYSFWVDYPGQETGEDLVLAVGEQSSGFFMAGGLVGGGITFLGLALVVWNLLQGARARRVAHLMEAPA